MTVFEKVQQIIAEGTDADVSIITPGAKLLGGRLYVSLDLEEGIMRCEEEFGIEIPDEETSLMDNTVGALVRLIENKLRDKPLRPGWLD